MKHTATTAFENINAYTVLQREYLSVVERHLHIAGANDMAFEHAIDGSLKMLDALNLREILRACMPDRILEVGSFLGFSLRWICESFPAASVVSVDPGVRHRVFDRPRDIARALNAKHLERITWCDAFFAARSEGIVYDYIHYEPRIPRERALELLRAIPVVGGSLGTFDLVFIDGDHSFKSTLGNIELCARMMPRGGTIVVHDAISWAEVEPAVKEAVSRDKRLQLIGVAGSEFETFIATHYAWSGLPAKQTSLWRRALDRLSARSLRNASHAQRRSLHDGLAIIAVAPSG